MKPPFHQAEPHAELCVVHIHPALVVDWCDVLGVETDGYLTTRRPLPSLIKLILGLNVHGTRKFYDQ